MHEPFYKSILLQRVKTLLLLAKYFHGFLLLVADVDISLRIASVFWCTEVDFSFYVSVLWCYPYTLLGTDLSESSYKRFFHALLIKRLIAIEAKEHQATHAESEFRIISDDQLTKAHDPSAGKIHHDRSLVRKKKKKEEKSKERKKIRNGKKEGALGSWFSSFPKKRKRDGIINHSSWWCQSSSCHVPILYPSLPHSVHFYIW